MKKLLALALVVMVAGGAMAQDANFMGMYFSDTDFSDETTNIDTTGVPFNGYVVLQNVSVATVGGYEVGITLSDGTVFVLTATGPNGWLNFGGTNLNHLVGFQTPVVCDANGNAIVSTINFLSFGAPCEVTFGSAAPSSFNYQGPGIANGANPDELILFSLSSDDLPPYEGVVATFNGAGVIGTENHSWTGVKALFD